MRCGAERFRAGARILALLCVVALPACGADAAGELVVVHNAEATLDGQVAGSGDPISPGAVLATNATGVAEFALAAPSLTCEVFADAEVEILPGGDAAFRHRSGSTVCRVPGTGGETVQVLARDRRLSVRRAVFRVAVEPDDVAFQMVEGDGIVAAAAPSPEGSPGAPSEGGVPVPLVTLSAGSQFTRQSTPGDQAAGTVEPLDPATVPEREWEVAEQFRAALQAGASATEEGSGTTPATEEPTGTTPATETVAPTEETSAPTEETAAEAVSSG